MQSLGSGAGNGCRCAVGLASGLSPSHTLSHSSPVNLVPLSVWFSEKTEAQKPYVISPATVTIEKVAEELSGGS